MARKFASGSSEYLLNTGTPPISALPFSMAVRFRSTSNSLQQVIMGMSPDAGNTEEYLLIAGGNKVGDPVRFFYRGTASTPDTSSGYSTNTWHHACCVAASATSRAVYIDGGSKGTNVASNAYVAPDRTLIGAMWWTGGSLSHFSGDIAEAAIWNVALSDSEVAQLAAGFSPLMVRPDGLVGYWPMGGIYGVNSANAADADYDIVGGLNMNPVNTPSTDDHPTNLIYPNSGLVVPSAFVSPTGNRRRRFLIGAA